MIKRILVATSLLCMCCILFAQTVQVKGKVVSENEVVEFANVVLQTKDSIFIAGGVTDSKGRFMMENIQAGSYLLCISGMGYTSRIISLDHLAVSKDLGVIMISPESILLKEVVVTGASVINAADRKIILPTAHQLKSAGNGLSLLQQMKLSRIQVDQMRNKVTSSGEGDVQLRMNGVNAEIQDILVLRTEDVIRIEYHDAPGLRYGDHTAAVIDYIVRRHETGGYVALDAQDSPHVLFGNNNFMVKINHKKSEFGLNYNNVYRSVDNYWRNNWETFRYEDGSSFTRVEDGIPSRISTYGHNIGLNYSFQDQGKWFFNSTVRWAFNKNKQNNQSSLYVLEKPEEILMMKEHSTGRTSRPSVDLYFQCKLNNDQSLIINAVTTYIDTQSDRSYTEEKSDEPLTDIYSTVSGNKYSFIGEGIYERKITKKSRLSAGLKYQQSLADNTYGGNESSETKMHETHATAYVEYSGKMDRFNYSFGLQGSYSRFKQKEEGYNRYSLLPRLRFGYQFSDNVFVRYRGQISRKSPGLSDMGNVRQLIDSLQVRSGNPELKIFTVYKNELEADFRKGLFSGNFHLSYQYQHRPIMEETIRDKNNSFVRTNANQLSWQKLNPELELKLGPLKDILTFSFSTGINYYDSRGLDYHHTYTNWYYRAEVMASYKRWSGFFQMENHRNNFYGETLSYGESFHTLGLSYRYKRLNIGVMTLNPFVDNYRMGGEMFSKVAPSKNWWYVKESCRLFVAKVSWNISFGRKYETMQKRVYNEDSNAGTLKSGK